MNNHIGLSVTLIIILITGLISFQAFRNQPLFNKLKHFPYQEKRTKEFYRLLTAGFVHGDMMHLLVNMYVLYMFGLQVENAFGVIYGASIGRYVFLIMYLLNIVFASLPTFAKHKDNPGFASVGASGAVSGILFIFIVLRPWHPLQFIFLPFIDIPAIILGVGYLLYSSYAAKKQGGRIDHMAHFYGALFGVLFLWTTKPQMILEFYHQLISIF